MSLRPLLIALLLGSACGRDAARPPQEPAAPPTADTRPTPLPTSAPASPPTADTAAEPGRSPASKPYNQTQPLDSAVLRACQLLPADESRQDASLQGYLAKLNRIVTARDARGLLALVDTNTVSSYGGGVMGKHDFANTWELHRGPASPIWPKLRRILALGGVFSQGDEGREFRLPYAQATERISCNTANADWYSVAVCLRPATEVHLRPAAESAVRVRLPYSVVKVDEEQDAGRSAWVRVSDMSGHRLGYVREDDLCFTADYKLILVPTAAGRWRIAAYAPFD